MNINQIMKILTIIVGSLSLIGFITKIFDIGLLSSFNLYLTYYQNIIYPIIGYPFDIFHITVPLVLYDFWTISFLCSTAYIRADNIEKSRFYYKKYSETGLPVHIKIIDFFVFGFTGASLFILFSILNSSFYHGYQDITRSALKNLLLIIFVTFLFFVVNAFAPSV